MSTAAKSAVQLIEAYPEMATRRAAGRAAPSVVEGHAPPFEEAPPDGVVRPSREACSNAPSSKPSVNVCQTVASRAKRSDRARTATLTDRRALRWAGSSAGPPTHKPTQSSARSGRGRAPARLKRPSATWPGDVLRARRSFDAWRRRRHARRRPPARRHAAAFWLTLTAPAAVHFDPILSGCRSVGLP